MEFQSTVDVGVVATGVVTMRATVYRKDLWVDVATLGQDPVVSKGGQYAQDYLADQESDPEMALALARARRRISATGGAQQGIAGLRLAAGLSQRQLAERMGTQQPAVARWERDPEQMTFPTIRQLAKALKVTEQQIFDAQREAAGVTRAAASDACRANA